MARRLTSCKLVSVYTMSTQKEETRVRLLSAARKLLVKRGFHGVGLEDIAEAAGVSRQAVYKSHFASKADLLLELVRHLHVAEKLDELVRPYLAAQSGLEMLHEGIRTIVLIEARIHDIALVLTAAALTDQGAAAALHDRLEVKRGAIRGALERVRADGHFSSAWQLEEAVDVLAALLSVDSYQQLVTQRGWQPEQLINGLTNYLGLFWSCPRRARHPEKKPRARLPEGGSGRFTRQTQDFPLEQAATHAGHALHASALQDRCGNCGTRTRRAHQHDRAVAWDFGQVFPQCPERHHSRPRDAADRAGTHLFRFAHVDHAQLLPLGVHELGFDLPDTGVRPHHGAPVRALRAVRGTFPGARSAGLLAPRPPASLDEAAPNFPCNR